MQMPELNSTSLAFYLGILVTIEQAIGQGSVSLAHVVPETWAPYVQSWCTLLAFVGTTIMTALTGHAVLSSQVPAPPPTVKP